MQFDSHRAETFFDGPKEGDCHYLISHDDVSNSLCLVRCPVALVVTLGCRHMSFV
jgi:hypothetical protein